MELCQGRGRWGLGKGSAKEGGGHGLELLELKEHWDVWSMLLSIGFDFRWSCVERRDGLK